MSRNGKSFNQVFKTNVPPGYIEKVVEAVVIAYLRAPLECARMRMEQSERENAEWVLRRAFIERGMRDAAAPFPEVETEVIKGRESSEPNPWNHTLVRCGSVWITQIKAQHPDEAPRHSCSREEYSERNQRQLFERGDERPPRPTPRTQYAIIIHGKTAPSSDRVGFIYVRYPTSSGLAWHLDEHIDLLKEFPGATNLVYQQPPEDLTPPEHIDEPGGPKLKDDSMNNKKGEQA